MVAAALTGPRLRRAKSEKKQVKAREHLKEAQVRSAGAEKEAAAAQEQAARARRERTEMEERFVSEEREAQQRADRAAQQRAEAESLQGERTSSRRIWTNAATGMSANTGADHRR